MQVNDCNVYWIVYSLQAIHWSGRGQIENVGGGEKKTVCIEQRKGTGLQTGGIEVHTWVVWML